MIDLDTIKRRYERYAAAFPCADGDRFWATCAAITAAEQVPALLAEIERLTAEVDHLRGMVDAAVVWAAPPGPVADEIRAMGRDAAGVRC